MTSKSVALSWTVGAICAAVLITSAFGQTETSAPSEPTSAETATSGSSSQSPTGGLPPHLQLRDPFWPVGFNPHAGEQPEEPTEKPKEPTGQPVAWQEAIKQLSIRGVMKMDAGYVAMVSDQIVRPNDVVSVDYMGNRYRWKVRSISEKGVRFEPLDANSSK